MIKEATIDMDYLTFDRYNLYIEMKCSLNSLSKGKPIFRFQQNEFAVRFLFLI